MIKYLTMLLAVVGLGLGGLAIVQTNEAPPNPPLAGTPSVNPFGRGIAASGVVEAASRNIPVSAPEGGLVTEVLVQVGDEVAAGQPLFRLDDRLLWAELVQAQAGLRVAEADLARLEARPRPEEGPPLAAARDAARARLMDAEDWYQSTMTAKQENAASANEASRRRFAVQTARAELAQAEAEYALWEAGSWRPELEVARAQVQQAQARIASIEILLERLVARSPVGGRVLKRNVEPGEYAPAGAARETVLGTTRGTMVVGDLGTLHVRARVDEEDVPRLAPGASAVARQRGAAEAAIPLRMLRIEPLAVAKRDLTGENTERVDTRVIEVVFVVTEPAAAAGPSQRLYPGQQLDVFIDTPDAGEPR